MIYLLPLIWIAYAIIEGKREAIFWHHRIKSSDYPLFKDIDRHPLFATQRALVLGLLFIASFYILNNLWLSIYLMFMNTLIFSFFHNGMMYLERKNMSKIASPINSYNWIYERGWWDQSTTSTAISTKLMTPISRTIQMIIGILGYILLGFF